MPFNKDLFLLEKFVSA